MNQQNYSNDLLEFNCKLLKWKKIKNESFHEKGVYEHSSIIKNDKMFVFGGYPTPTFCCIYEFNFSNEKWKIIEDSKINPPIATIGHSCIYFENSLFIFGGRTNFGLHSNDLYEFNFKKKKWKQISTFNSPTPRKYHNSFLCENSMFIFGGSDSDGIFSNNLFELNLINNHWNENKNYSNSIELNRRCYHGSCEENERKFFISGGENDENYGLSDLFSIEFENTKKIFNSKKKFSFSIFDEFFDCIFEFQNEMKRKNSLNLISEIELNLKKKKKKFFKLQMPFQKILLNFSKYFVLHVVVNLKLKQMKLKLKLQLKFPILKIFQRIVLKKIKFLKFLIFFPFLIFLVFLLHFQ